MFDAATGLLTGLGATPCGYESIVLANGVGYHPCLLMDRLLGEVTNDMHASWLADDSVRGQSNQTTIDFTLTGEFELMGKFIGFAFSADHQKQNYDLTPSVGRLDPNIEFVQGSTIDGDGKRNRDSVGLEFQIPVTNKLEVNIASRFDKYDDASSNVGSRRTTMASFAYRPNTKLLIRGSGSQTFRAPDMNYLFQSPSSGFIGLIDYVRCFDGVQAYIDAGYFTDLGTVNNWNCAFFGSSARAFLEGNPDLEEEKGENYQLGLVWEINNNTTFYLDAYEVELNDAVSRESSSQLILLEGACLYGDDFKDWMVDFNFPDRDCNELLGKIERGPQLDPFNQPFDGVGSLTSVSPDYINQSYLNYVGVDWQIRYDLETENRGDFILNIYSSNILKSSDRVDKLSEEIDALDAYIYEPRSQQNISLSWLYQDLAVSLFSDRLGHMEIYRGQKTKPHFTTNLTVRYDYSSALDFYVGVRNIEDKMPQLDAAYSWPFYNQNYFSAIGRYISTGFNYRF
jgi:outer membrane receptor protein involved in Fe transport